MQHSHHKYFPKASQKKHKKLKPKTDLKIPNMDPKRTRGLVLYNASVTGAPKIIVEIQQVPIHIADTSPKNGFCPRKY